MLAVEAAMRAYAPRFDGDVELWGLTGLLHDLDYERYPDLSDGHPRYALRALEEHGYPPELVRAVASHADFMGVPRETPMEKTLYAVDELCGFVLAVAYVRPDGLVGLTPKSVKKKLKQPSFAAAVNREELRSRRAGARGRLRRAPHGGDRGARGAPRGADAGVVGRRGPRPARRGAGGPPARPAAHPPPPVRRTRRHPPPAVNGVPAPLAVLGYRPIGWPTRSRS